MSASRTQRMAKMIQENQWRDAIKRSLKPSRKTRLRKHPKAFVSPELGKQPNGRKRHHPPVFQGMKVPRPSQPLPLSEIELDFDVVGVGF